MSDPAIFEHFILPILVLGLSLGITWRLRRARVMDIPNDRSSHDRPVPRIGGIAIVATFFTGVLALFLAGDSAVDDKPHVTVLAVALAMIALVGLLDDLGRLRSLKWKLGAQLLAALALVISGLSFERIPLPYLGIYDMGVWGAVLTVLWLIGITNAVNFMDGLNGLVAGTCILVAFFFGLVTFIGGGTFVYMLCYVLVAGTLGFLVFNFPKASIFMGDVGSQFLGFALGALAIVAAEQEASRTSLLVMPLLFFHFIFDTLFTFVRRLISGENVSQAHRSHLYQLLNRLGLSHAGVSMFHFGMTVLQGMGAVILSRLAPEHQLIMFVPFLIFETAYAWTVTRLAIRNHLLPARS